MSTAPAPVLRTLTPSLRAALPGLLLAVSTLLFGYLLGAVFGLNEDLIKSRLADSAQAVLAATYNGDNAAAKAVVDKSWAYMQRAHLHAGGLGASAVALIAIVVMLDVRATAIRLVSLALGAGGLGYAIFWMLAGFRAPGLGSTGAAKESLAWLAIPSSGAVLIATFAVAYFLVRALGRSARTSARRETSFEH